MAVFILKAEHGSSYVPPACAGLYSDVPCPSFFADWIEQLDARGSPAGAAEASTARATPTRADRWPCSRESVQSPVGSRATSRGRRRAAGGRLFRRLEGLTAVRLQRPSSGDRLEDVERPPVERRRQRCARAHRPPGARRASRAFLRPTHRTARPRPRLRRAVSPPGIPQGPRAPAERSEGFAGIVAGHRDAEDRVRALRVGSRHRLEDAMGAPKVCQSAACASPCASSGSRSPSATRRGRAGTSRSRLLVDEHLLDAIPPPGTFEGPAEVAGVGSHVTREIEILGQASPHGTVCQGGPGRAPGGSRPAPRAPRPLHRACRQPQRRTRRTARPAKAPSEAPDSPGRARGEILPQRQALPRRCERLGRLPLG